MQYRYSGCSSGTQDGWDAEAYVRQQLVTGTHTVQGCKTASTRHGQRARVGAAKEQTSESACVPARLVRGTLSIDLLEVVSVLVSLVRMTMARCSVFDGPELHAWPARGYTVHGACGGTGH